MQRLVHAEARRRAHAAIDAAPDGYIVRVSPPKRSLEQSAKLHAELGEIAASIPWAGKLRTIEVWKRLIVAAWLRARGESIEVLPALDGHGVDLVYAPTSDLTVAQMGELLEFVAAWRAENQPAA
jgi:hypothetical protein